MLNDRRRILIATSAQHQGEFKSLFEREPLQNWDTVFADCFSRARFNMQQNPCDALMVHEDLLEKDGGQGLSWLAWKREFPVLFVGQSPKNFQRAYELGVQHCLPFDMALTHPPLVATAFEQAKRTLDNSLRLDRSKEQLTQTRRHIDRLVTLMWRSSPAHQENQWYSQPFMMERLNEELARAERHKVPLSLAVGELKQPEVADYQLPEWTPDVLVKGKRRCDVVGQYGARGFMLLMVHTPKTGGIICCKRLQSALEKPGDEAPVVGPRPAVRAYFGLTTTQGDRNSPQSVLRSAEQNLDAARLEPAMRIVSD